MSLQQRNRRDERPKNPKPMRLTARDLEIIRAVYEYRVLTTPQLQCLFFPSMHQAYARLASLFHHEFLDRRFLGVYTDKMNTPILYVLDRRGAELLQSELELSVAWQPSHKDVSNQFLEHTLAINDVRIAMTLACQQEDDFALLEWLSESDLKADYDRVTIQTEAGKSQNISLIPDSYFTLSTPLGESRCFLELDRATMTLKRFKQKILAYQQYYKTGAYQKRYQSRSLRILTVTTSQSRADNLKNATEEVAGKQRFWFTTLEEIAHQTVLHTPIWQVASLTQNRPLIDL